MSWEDSYRVNVPSITVQEQNKTSRQTGILDANGQQIVREEPRERIGFVHFPDRPAP